MADVKISQLPEVTGLSNSDVLPVVASAATSKITMQNLAGAMPEVSSSISASYALTASYLANYIEPFPYTGSANITGSLTVTGSTNLQALTASSIFTAGTITAQTLVVQTVSSSIVYSSGSNTFGDELTDTQQFTGSVSITGSLSMLQGVANLTASYALTSSINQINQSQYRFELVTTIDQDIWLYPATIIRVVKSPGVATAQYRTGSAEAFNTITFTGNDSTTPIAVKVNDEFSWRITYNSGYTTAALTVVSQRS